MSRTTLLPLLASAVLATAVSSQVAQSDRVISVPGTDATIRIWAEQGITKTAVSRDGGASWFQLKAPRYELSFRHMAFDPADGEPAVPPQLMARNNNELYYVQFETDIVPEYRTALEQMGLEVLYHFPHQSYIVRMSRSDAATVADQDFVRAVADMHPAYKLEASIVADVLTGTSTVDTYDIMLANKATDAAGVEAAVAEVGELVGKANGGILVTANLTTEGARTLAADSRVLWIEKLGNPEVDIDNLRIVAGVNNTVAKLGGQEFGRGMAGHVHEGVYQSHCDLQGTAPWSGPPIAVLVNGTGSAGDGHGTNTAGEIYSTGLNRPDGKGILPLAQMTYTNSSATFNNNNRYSMTQELTDPNDVYLVSFQTASWGYPRSTQYTSRSAEMDDIMMDFDLLVTNSQSNSGSTPSRPQAWAKNVIGVGGFNHFNNTNPADDCHCNTGSTGPAADGRVGVTFASFYDSILTTNGTGCGYSTSFGGTSGATPTVNGLAGATIEMWTDGHFGGPAAVVDANDPFGTRASRFAIRPHYTTTRALMTMGTDQVDISQATRVEQGWGRPNVETLYDNRNNILAIDELDVLNQGESASYIVWVPPGVSEFRASSHHAEPEAVPNANPTRHNSVDLSVTDPNGNTYWGNRGGILGNEFTQTPGLGAEPGPNDVDLHENVFLQNPVSGVYAVNVAATTITMDNHFETAATDLDFGLAIRGIGGGRDTSGMTLDMDSTGAGNWTVSVSNLPGSFDGGWTIMSADTSRDLGFGHLFGVMVDGLAAGSILSPQGAGNVFHFTNTAGSYPNTTFTFPVGVALAVQGMTFDAVCVTYDANGVNAVSSVDRVTIQ